MGLLNMVGGGAKEPRDRRGSRSKSDAPSTIDSIPRSDSVSSAGGGEVGESGNDTENLDKEEGNVLMALIAQCEYPKAGWVSGL